MQRHVCQVITRQRIHPETMLNPERGMQNRVVLLSCAELPPDSPQAVKRLEIWPGNVSGVVPQQVSVKGGPIRDEGDEKEQRPFAEMFQGGVFDVRILPLLRDGEAQCPETIKRSKSFFVSPAFMG